MRGALALLDWRDASIADLRRLLLRAAFAPAFLRAADGRRFLAHLFTLDVRAPPVAHAMSALCACKQLFQTLPCTSRVPAPHVGRS